VCRKCREKSASQKVLSRKSGGKPDVDVLNPTYRLRLQVLVKTGAYICTNFFLMAAKKATDSLIIMTELVLPNDTNTFGNLMGGRLMYWMDIAAALSAMKHCGAPVVTASVDNISFESPIRLGNVVHLEAKVSRALNHGLEVHMKVREETVLQQTKYKGMNAYFNLVCLAPHVNPGSVPQLIAETDDEHKLFEGALRRRQLRLILGGKMKPADAQELKALFIKE